MYSSEQLARYPFFRELLRETPLASMHDGLTGLIARPYILRFVQALIADEIPFVMGIVDLDNFKSINDNYGHRTGDEMLIMIAQELQSFYGEDGLVGRYGGDEFLFVYFGCTDYDGIHRFFDDMYAKGGVFRKNLLVRDRTLFSTATVGCAVYPTDADSFEGLFALADKTLYRGKSKGRNCFIIYVPEKHDHLEIPTLARRSLYDTFARMADEFDRGGSTEEKLRLAFLPVRDNLRMYRLFFVDTENRLFDLDSGDVGVIEPLGGLLQHGLFTAHSLEELKRYCPSLDRVLNELGFESVMVSEVVCSGRVFGYLVFCPEVHTLHMWQENESVAAFFLSRMLARHLEANGGSFRT